MRTKLTLAGLLTGQIALSLVNGVLGLLAGCTVGPRYEAPKSSLAPLHNAAAVESRAPSSPAPPLDRWWSGFRDPQLTRIIERVLNENLDLAAALAQVVRARAVAGAAAAELAPSADLTADAAALHQSLESPIGTIARHLPGYDRNQKLYDAGAAASWELDLFGGLRRNAAAAGAEAEAAEAGRLGVRVSVAAEAADTYLQVRGFQARLEVAQQQITTDAELLKLVRLRVEAGAAADRELAEAEALLAQAQASVPLLRRALDTQLNRLDVLMGAQPGTYAAELRPSPGIAAEIPSAPAISLDDAAQQLLRRRPDIIVAERRLAASNARIAAAIADYYPKLSLAAVLGFESLNGNHLFSAEAFQPLAALGLRWRLFDFGRVDAEVVEARGAELEALARYRQSVLRAAEDIEDALSALAETESRTVQLQRETDALERARRTSEEDYKAGASALTEVLDANRELLTAQDDLAGTRADASRAAVAVFRALGGGWQ